MIFEEKAVKSEKSGTQKCQNDIMLPAADCSREVVEHQGVCVAADNVACAPVPARSGGAYEFPAGS